jgi:hypothetical protein
MDEQRKEPTRSGEAYIVEADSIEEAEVELRRQAGGRREDMRQASPRRRVRRAGWKRLNWAGAATTPWGQGATMRALARSMAVEEGLYLLV